VVWREGNVIEEGWSLVSRSSQVGEVQMERTVDTVDSFFSLVFDRDVTMWKVRGLSADLLGRLTDMVRRDDLESVVASSFQVSRATE
jgi:hypothetical protein